MNKPTEKDYATAKDALLNLIDGNECPNWYKRIEGELAQIIADRVADETQALTAERDDLIGYIKDVIAHMSSNHSAHLDGGKALRASERGILRKAMELAYKECKESPKDE